MKEIKIPSVRIRGEEKYKTFSIRIPNELYDDITQLECQTELSRNQVITILLTKAIDIAKVSDE